MWPFKKRIKNRRANAESVAPLLMDACKETSASLLRSLLGVEGAAQNQSLLPSVELEELAFALHLTDRLLFAHYGADQRALFMDDLLPSVKKLLDPPFDGILADLYNTRQQFYASLRFPANSQDLKGTLFWEFGKALAAVYADMNPVAVTMTASFGAMLVDLVDEVLRATRIIKGAR